MTDVLSAPPAGAAEADPEPIASASVDGEVPIAPPSAGDVSPVPASAGTSTAAAVPGAATAPTVDADRAFADLVRAQRLMLAKGDDGGLAGAGSGGHGVGVGLTTELSGRRVAASRVVTVPVITKERPIECQLPATLRLIAVVRVLVTRDGAPAVPRLLKSSGDASFDRCAVSYVLALRFAPGLDDRARPLDVWMNVQVTPTAGGVIAPVN